MSNFNSLIEDKFENYLKKNSLKLKSFHPYFEKASNEMLNAGGKRFRPKLLLSVVDSFTPLLIENSLSIALAIEILHTYSLIHDDLPTMDNADLRRGHPTLHKTYDEVTAILVGDGLNTHAFYLISTAPLSSDIKVELIEELSLNGGLSGMVLGQAIDCYFEDKKLNLNELKILHLNKTAKLIASSLKMGAIISNLDKNYQIRLYDFGLKLGLMFQIQDDIIDVTQDESESGKSANRDEDKNSFVNLLGLNGAISEKDKLILELKSELNSFDEKLRENLLNLIEKYFK